MGHISVDILVYKKDLDDLRIGGCISSPNLSIFGGGVAANVAYWLGSLGTNVSMIGVIADDPSGLLLRKDLENVGVKCILKFSEKNPSASILSIVEENGERSFIINGKCLDELTLEDIPISDIVGDNLFYTSAYNIENPPICDTVKEVLEISKKDKKTSFDVLFNLAAYTTVERFHDRIKNNILPYTDILLGNLEEYMTLVSMSKEEIKLLKRLYPKGNTKKIAEQLGRPLTAVRQKAYDLGIKTKVYQYWTEQEIRLLRKIYSNTSIGDLTKRFGRTEGSIRIRA